MPANTDSGPRRFLREVGLILGIPLLIVVPLLIWWAPWKVYTVPAGTSILSVAADMWDWAHAEEFCVEDPHQISFSPDSSLMTLTYKEGWVDSAGIERRAAEYDILEITSSHVRGRIRGEERRTDAGEPVVWDLVLISPDEYRWHRTDWDDLMFTKSVRRCPER